MQRMRLALRTSAMISLLMARAHEVKREQMLPQLQNRVAMALRHAVPSAWTRNHASLAACRRDSPLDHNRLQMFAALSRYTFHASMHHYR